VSRTKTGGDPLGRYDTPAWAVHALLDAIGPDLPTDRPWLEPCAGNGSIICAVEEYGFQPEWDAIDIEPRGECGPTGDLIARADFFDWHDNLPAKATSPKRYAVVPSNPPYRLAYQFAVRCVAVSTWTALLLRLNWLAGAEDREPERGAFLDRTRPDVFVLPNRPKFTRDGRPIQDEHGNVKKGVDATDYGWFVWHPDCDGRWYRLPNVPKEVRRT
jgi:hypothetical protein